MIEQGINLFVIIADVIGLVICLFRYVDKPRRSWIYATIFLLGNLLSDYYWSAYCLLMGDDPDVSSFFAYLGVNISFLPIVFLLLHLRSEGEKHYFSPLALLPVPLNIWQFTIYIQYGGYFNNIWQCFFTTVIVVLALNSIFYWFKNRKNGADRPYVAFVMFFFVLFEYVMWTSSCYDWPSELLDPYYYANVFAYSTMILLPVALIKTYKEKFFGHKKSTTRRLSTIFKPVYTFIVIICCAGGYLLAMWMKSVIDESMVLQEDMSSPYQIIKVMLFIASALLVVASATIIIVVYLGKKAADLDQIREEKAIAEQSNAAKSEFLASMSHEIRTPINAVLGMNEMVLRQSLKARDRLPGDPEAVRGIFTDISNYAGNIDSAGNNLLSIINDILDFSKIEAGKMEIVNGEYKLSNVLNDVSNMIFFRARNKGLSFVVDVDETTPDVLFGDGVHVRQVITNVLNNAVKYTDHGSVELVVRGHREKDTMSGDWVDLVVDVKDTGIGIREEDIDRLFAKFERVDLEHNKTVEGTGLGLAITRNLLEMMGGEVSVSSVYGEGSTFTLHIPQQVISDEQVGNFREKFEQRMKEAKAYKESFVAKDAHILVADDTKMNLVVFTSLLRETKINIDTADNGAEGVKLASEKAYDVIFLDQRMPGMDGSEALRHIREQQGGLNVEAPIVCLTADAVVGAREKYIAEGFTDYLTKPIDSRELEKMLVKYIPDEKITYELDEPGGFDESSWDKGPAEAAAGVASDQGAWGEHSEELSAGNDLSAEEQGSADVFAPLRKAGIDPDAGLQFLNDDEDLYRAVLQEFARDEIGKSGDLQRYFMERDWKNYEIIVHALKNTAKTIGAMELSDMAFELEKASAAEDAGTVESNHDTMLYMYSKTADAVRDFL